jgi:hypothetical protein
MAYGMKDALTTAGRFFTSCNASAGGSPFTLNSAGRGASIAYNPKSNTFMTLVQDQADFSNSYNIISGTGIKLSQGVAFSGSRNGSGGNFAPFVAPNTNDGSFGAISSIDYMTTRFASGISK